MELSSDDSELKSFKEAKDRQEESTWKPLCHNHILYGVCRQPYTCPQRHFLNESDVPSGHLPLKGQIELRVKKFISPVHLIAEIVRDREAEKRDLEFMFEFQDFYLENANQNLAKMEFKVGDICVLDDSGLFKRCRIMEIEQVKGYLKLLLSCLDTGSQYPTFVHSASLLEITPEFRDYPPKIVHIHLTNVMPIDQQSGWSEKSFYITDFFMDITKDGKLKVLTTVRCTLNGHIFVDSLEVVEHARRGQTIVQIFNISSELESRRLAIKNPNGGLLISHMAKEFGIYEKVQPYEEIEDVKQDRAEKELMVVQPIVKEEKSPGALSITKYLKCTEFSDDEEGESMEVDKKVVCDDPENVENYYDDFEEDEDYYPDDCAEIEEWLDDENHNVFQYNLATENEFEDFDVNFGEDDYEDLAELIRASNNENAIKQAGEASEAYATTSQDHEMLDDQISAKVDQCVVPRLQKKFNYPEMFWSQTDTYIKLKIKAVDLKDYHIQVLGKAIIFVFKFENEIKGGILNLFGAVVPKTAVVSLRGLTIVINVPKRVPGAKFLWSRLLKTKARNIWLHSDLIGTSDENDALDRMQYTECNNDSSEDDSSSDEDCVDFSTLG